VERNISFSPSFLVCSKFVEFPQLISSAMTRRTAKNAQADIARAIRAAKQSGAECVEVRRDGTIVILLKAPPLVPADEDALKNGNGNMNRRKLPGVATASPLTSWRSTATTCGGFH
jgi:hypothetical protein